jgi:phosphatidylinositol alpha-1,6-mannosyltransferase
VWTLEAFPSSFWDRYTAVFDSVRVVARVLDVATVPAGATRVDSSAVSVHAVPHYLGPAQFLRRRRAVVRSLAQAVRPDDAVLLRVPSTLGSLLADLLEPRDHPVSLEVVGDPHDVFGPGAVRHPLRPLLRRWFVSRLRRQCRRAAAVAYVTERSLQRRYPAGPDAVTTSYSSIDLRDDAFAPQPRPAGQAPWTLVSVGSLEQLYKGTDVLIDAVAQLVASGLDVTYEHVGDGRHRPELEHRARALGLADRVRLLGALPAGAQVREVLDRADVFVLPSRTEGLPRALIEAMARGLPAVGSTAGGIPELLPGADLVPPGDASALARRLRALLLDPVQRESSAARNLAHARTYASGVLGPRRTAFYEAVRDRTARYVRDSTDHRGKLGPDHAVQPEGHDLP